MAKTKVAIVTPLYPPDIGRPAEYVKELSRRLQSDLSVTVMTYGSMPEDAEGVRLAAVRKDRPVFWRMWDFFFCLWRESRGAGVMLVCDGASVGLPSVLVSFLRGIPMVRYVLMDEALQRAGQASGLKIRFVGWLQRLVLWRAKKVFFADERTIRAGRTSGFFLPFPPETLHKLPFVVERRRAEVLSVGSSLTDADVRMLFGAVAKLTSALPDIRIKVTGDSPRVDEIKRLAEERGIAERVECLGYVSRAEWSSLVRSAAVFYLGGGNADLHQALFAAYTAGLPVIASDSPGIQSVLEDQVSGVVVRSDEADILAGDIRRLMDKSELHAVLIAGGQRIMQDRFGWDAHVAAWKSVFNEIA